MHPNHAYKRFFVLLFCLCFAHPSSAEDGDRKALGQRLEGTWVRPNCDYWIVIKGNKWSLYEDKQQFKPKETGDIVFERNKDHARVKTSTGFIWYLWSAGDDVIAAEVFERDTMELHEHADGRVFYRQGTNP